MTLEFWNRKLFLLAAGMLLLFLASAGGGLARAQDIVLHLKSGDQISGFILSENAKQVVISNSWVKALPIPRSEIARREPSVHAGTVAATPKHAAKKSRRKPKPARVAAAAPPSRPAPTKIHGKWHGKLSLGVDSLISTKNQQDYFSRLKLTYTRPYASNSKKFFRNTSQVSGDYQKTDGQESANRANAKNKSDFDVGQRSYGYCSANLGFDEVRKVDFKYQVGPGVGSHLMRSKHAVLDVESGLDYETQYRRNNDDLRSFFLRLAQDWTWSIRRNLKLTENFAFYPNLEPVDIGQYRIDFASTLSYGFWQNLTLDLTTDERYNTEVASGVNRNELEVRLMLGTTF